MKAIVSSVRVTHIGGHDHVEVWNRGGKAGTLVVNEGDGKAIAVALRAVIGDGMPDTQSVEQSVRNMVASGLRIRAHSMPDERGAELNHVAMLIERDLLHVPDGVRAFEIEQAGYDSEEYKRRHSKS